MSIDLEVRIHDRLRLARERAGLAQRDIAKKLNVSESSVSGWEKGTSQPRNLPKAVRVYAELTGYPEAWLWTGSASTSVYNPARKPQRKGDSPRRPAKDRPTRSPRVPTQPPARRAA